MTQTNRNYKATFILDNRGKEDSVDQIIESVKQEISAVAGEVTAVDNLGRRDFIRVTDDKFPGGVYVQVDFSAPATAPAQLHERLRLNASVYRAVVEKCLTFVNPYPRDPMANLNKVMLIGNLTRDPELRVTPKGTAICTFSIAVNRKFKDESGGEREEVTYVDIEAWGRSGENISKYCTKGRPLFVEGRLRLDQWEDKNTKEKRSRMKVVLENFQFLGGRGDSAGGGEGGEGRSYAPRSNAPRPAAPAPQESLDEDVPF